MIATILNVHGNIECSLDTIDSIRTYLGDNILVVVDGCHWNAWKDVKVPASKIRGINHGSSRSPYKNVALGLQNAWELWHDQVQWYCYAEYDCLFTSNRILQNLQLAKDNDIYILGNDGHVDEIQLPVVESIVKMKFNSSYYLLGACQFISHTFMNKLVEMNFFEKLLVSTSSYTDGFFPLYSGYDISEHLYPTLARNLGGKVGVFATYDYVKKKWHGSYEVFPVRWRPELDPETENFPQASIIHPLKSYDHPLREHHRKIRNAIQTS